MRFSTLWALGWRASRSSGVSRAKAGGEGVEPLFPAAMSTNVHGCFIRAISEVNTF
jgi:hypothetical protein